MSVKSKKARKRRHRRIRMTISGTSERPRLVVFRSLKHIYAQVIDDVAGKTMVSASTVEAGVKPNLEGKNKRQQAELIGKLVAERATDIGIKDVVFDRGGYRYHGRVKSLADGAREKGLKF